MSDTAPPPLGLTDFLARIRDFASRNFDNAEVLPFLRGGRIRDEDLASYLHWTPERYTRNLVELNGDFALIVLCWSPGQAAPVHGHEGEKCWARVERGRLRFVNYRETGRTGDVATLKALGTPREGTPGHVDGPADIHSVENLAAWNTPAVTLHLYTKPYPEFDVYDLATGRITRRKAQYDTR